MASGSEIEQLLQALKDWQKAVNQLTKKKMPLSAAEAQLAQAQQTVLAHLADEASADKLDKLHHRHRVHKMEPHELFRPVCPAGQTRD